MNDSLFHPAGEPESAAVVPVSGPVAVDTFGGRVHVEWDAQANMARAEQQGVGYLF